MRLENLYKINEDYFYVYEHWLNDEVIYVGKGKGGRAFSLDRNSYWHEKTKGNFNNIKVVVKGYFKSENDALEFERFLISKYLYEGFNIANVEYNFNLNDNLKCNMNNKNSKEKLSNMTFDNKIKSELKFSHNGQVLSLMKKLIEENADNKIVLFFDSKYKKIISQLEKEKLFKVLFLSKFKSEDYDEKVISEKISYQLNKGIIPDPYNVLLYPTDLLYFDEAEIVDPRVKLVIMNEKNEVKNKMALSKFQNDIDMLACRVERDKLITVGYKKGSETKVTSYSLIGMSTALRGVMTSYGEVKIPDKYLNKPLTAKDKGELCQKLDIINYNGEVSKWQTIKSILISSDSGYEVRDHTKTIKGKRTRVTTISPKDN